MRATGTDGRNAPESVDTKFDTNRDDKGLFQAMNNYKEEIIKSGEISGGITNKPLASKGLDDWPPRGIETTDNML
jgi:hypothetical protein